MFLENVIRDAVTYWRAREAQDGQYWRRGLRPKRQDALCTDSADKSISWRKEALRKSNPTVLFRTTSHYITVSTLYFFPYHFFSINAILEDCSCLKWRCLVSSRFNTATTCLFISWNIVFLFEFSRSRHFFSLFTITTAHFGSKCWKVVSLIFTTIFLLTKFCDSCPFLSWFLNLPKIVAILSLLNLIPLKVPLRINFRPWWFSRFIAFFQEIRIFSAISPQHPGWNGAVRAPFIRVCNALSLSFPSHSHSTHHSSHCLGSVCIWRPSVHSLAVECGCCCWLGELRASWARTSRFSPN